MMAKLRKVTFVVLVVVVAAAGGLWLLARQMLASDLTRATLEQQLSARLGRPVHVRAATAAVFPTVAVDLHDVTIGDAPPVRIGRIQVATGWRSLFTRTLAGVSIRSLAFRDIVLGTGDRTLTIDLDASLIGDRLDVRSLDARARATKIHARGALTSLNRMHGTFDVTADPLDLAEMIAIASALAPSSSVGGPVTPMHFVLTVASPRGRFGAYRFRDLTTTLDAAPGRLAFDNLAFQAFGGSFRGRAGADTSGAAPALRLNGKVAGLDLTQLLEGSGSAGGITGRLAASLTLQGSGGSADLLLRSARGTIAATVADGTLPYLDMVRPVVLAFGKPSGAPTAGTGTAFKTLGGTFALANGGLASDNLTLASRDLDLHGHGSLRLESGAVDARADVMLSPELTAQAGTDLRRYAQQDGRVVVPATVGGTLAAPHVSIDVAAAARRAAGNELKRRVTDVLGGLFKKKKGGG
jgi:uncharacterized protein involved in outer membrane biogenesis